MGKRAWYHTHMARMAERLWSLSDEEVDTAVPASVASIEDIPEYVMVEDLSHVSLPAGVSATMPKGFIMTEVSCVSLKYKKHNLSHERFAFGRSLGA